MKLIIGLGNPGKKYETTRHNIGFIVLDEVAKSLGVQRFDMKFKAMFQKVKYNAEDVILLKPQTFMNLSGESVIQVVEYFNIDICDILVIYDDLDLELGKLRLRQKGSSGGHNGIKSLENHLKTKEFKRLKFGIGRDQFIPTVKYVVSNFKKEEVDEVKTKVEVAKDICLEFISTDFISLMNKYN